MQSLKIEEKTYEERSLVGKALYIALMAHGGQEDLDNIPYFHHLLRVGADMSPDPEAMIVGFLHDVLEDTKVTREELYNLFGYSITEQINLLTRNENESYWDYINHLIDESRYYPKVLLVKHADLLDNLAPWRQDFLGAESLAGRHRVALRLVEKAMIERGLLHESQRYVRPDAPRTEWDTETVDFSGGAASMGCDEAAMPTEVSPGAYPVFVPEFLEPTLGELFAVLGALATEPSFKLPYTAEPPATPAELRTASEPLATTFDAETHSTNEDPF